MNQLTLSEATAFAHLSLPQFAPVAAVLRSERQDALERMAKAGDELTIRRLQGRVGLLDELLELVATAPSLADKLTKAPR